MAHLSNTEFQPLNIAVLTVSDTRNLTPIPPAALIDGLQSAGHTLAERAIVKDDIWQIRARSWIASENVQVVLITGGTGFTARDNTPQAAQPLLDKDVDGFGELCPPCIAGRDRHLHRAVPRAGRDEQRHAGLLPAGVRPTPAAPLGTRSSSSSWTAVPNPATSSRT